MIDQELMQDALDVMLAAIKAGDWKVDGACDPDWVLNALRARLAQPEPEPVAWRNKNPKGRWQYRNLPILTDGQPLYTTPPQREWQGLTDEEIKSAWSQLWHDLGNGKFAASDDPSRHTTVMFARAIEAKLKEKNT